MKEITINIILAIGLILLILGVFYGLSTLKGWQCEKRGEILGYQVKWTGFTGAWCVLNIDGKWIPYEKWVNNTGN